MIPHATVFDQCTLVYTTSAYGAKKRRSKRFTCSG